MRNFTKACVALTAVVLLCISATAQAQSYNGRPQPAVGSWFGRAVPNNTVCPAGSPGCPVPKEIVMVFTINADGTFIGIDSNIFAGASHSTAHGQWESLGRGNIAATFTLLQQGSNGVFLGGFKNLFAAQVDETGDNMIGQIDAYLYVYTNADGSAILGPDGLPSPSPLDPPALCATTNGCQHLGTFTFKARRVKTQF